MPAAIEPLPAGMIEPGTKATPVGMVLVTTTFETTPMPSPQ
jgi:hypothetical protein